MKKGSWQLLEFQSRGDHRGELIAIESLKSIPFDLKRIYYLILTKEGVRRGFHAHQKLDQVLIAITGSCRVLVDNGTQKEEYLLNNCKTGLRITNLVWREMFDFSGNCVLLVLANDWYREEDYVRNYADFLKLAGQKNEENFHVS